MTIVMPSRLEPLDDAEQLLHDDRRQPERELVDEQHVGVVQQRDRQRQHLLLAARQRRRAVWSWRSAEVGEQLEHPGDAPLAVGRSVR